MVGITLIIIIVLVILIYLLIEFKKFRHQIFAFLLIAFILFGYISATVVLKNKNIDYSSVGGIVEAGGIYFNWISSVVGNLGSLTSHSTKLNWSDSPNQSNQT